MPEWVIPSSRALGLTGTYQREFDIQNASAAIEAFDKVASAAAVTALLGTPRYLLIGTGEGQQFIFDG